MTYHTAHGRPAAFRPPVSSHVAFTLRLADASDDVLVRHVRLLRDCVAIAQQRWGFTIDAAVVLPSEVQLLCVFSDADFGVRGAIRLICAAFDRHLPNEGPSVWANATEIIEISPDVAPLRRAFIEMAPVRAGLVKIAADWPYSSAQKDALQGSKMGVAVA